MDYCAIIFDIKITNNSQHQKEHLHIASVISDRCDEKSINCVSVASMLRVCVYQAEPSDTSHHN